MALGFEVHHPGGMVENSPAFQRWDCGQTFPSPEGTADAAAFQASLRDAFATAPTPSAKALGYFRLSLRDRGVGPASQILVALDRNVRAPLWLRLRGTMFHVGARSPEESSAAATTTFPPLFRALGSLG